jgi:hypothetical protein
MRLAHGIHQQRVRWKENKRTLQSQFKILRRISPVLQVQLTKVD